MELADYSILNKNTFNDVYEPAEDTFILVDALEKDLDLIKNLKPEICLEIGSGSGVVISTLGKVLGPAYYLCTDLNPLAALATKGTSESNMIPVDVVVTDLLQGLESRLTNSVDLIICNPPYAVTPNEEVGGDNLQKATSGGEQGRQIINRLFSIIPKVLSSNGIFYLTCIKENDIRNRTLVHYFHKTVAKFPDNVCFVFEDEEWTYRQINDFSNKVAQCFIQQGYQKGDEVALFMENCPEFACFWLGLAKIGVVTALINTNQRSESLAHSMNIIDLKGVIFGQSLTESLKKSLPFLDKRDTADFYCYTRKKESRQTTLSFHYKSMNLLLDDTPATPVDANKHQINFQDKLIYIYTSGTTGLPKAAIIRHSRALWISAASQILSQLGGHQTFYNPLPMYHAAGGILFLGVVLMFGGKMVLRKKFSATNFWKEVVKHEVTVCQYIGEICRYLLNQPKTPEETQHSVWLFFGNGLRPHIWKEFQDRFRIKNIIELYGSTEGNANLVNMFGKVGSVGFVSRIFSRLYPVYLLKVNPETGELIRDENGLCVRCKPGEPGELVGKVLKNNPLNSFDGYVNTKETKKKIVRDCFQKGDTAFLSGDLLVMDEEGYLYFKDRTGDTFRWKGENISTSEVENIISKISNNASCVVYGVEIPGAEGRAGMAAIQIDLKNANFNQIYKDALERLPPYAVPVFLRICSDIEATGTYKLMKLSFKKEGYNPEVVKDPLYILDMKKKTYVPLTKEIYSDIMNGILKL